ncbi:MAG: DUF2066 domain-containing protein [Pseudomonadota bacterium]|nr:DUF2066 domain-containing protein [Pseudomonadota bacterium]MDE3038365.1 DUF2066 domain-containing protein [Pseudomonadota bacterium]
MRPIKILLCLSWACFALAALPSLASEALVNSDVDVDVVGKDAADARAQAMIKGESDALASLLDKLATPEQAQGIMSALNADKISGMVRGTEVLDEKISSNRYRAHLVVTFDGGDISGLISKMGAAGSAPSPQAVGAFLIIPVYEEDNADVLWEDGNPWRTVWKATALEVASGDIVVPFGDAQDQAVVNAQTIASANYATLAPLMIRYGVSDIVIAQAKFTRLPDMTLTVIRRHISRTENEVNMLTYRADPQETKNTLLARAARDIADGIKHIKIEETQSVMAVHGGDRSTVMVLASISTLASWTDIRARLSALPMVDQLELLAMSPQQVDMIIHYRGTAESLANAITSKNIRLVKNSKYWVVSRD